MAIRAPDGANNMDKMTTGIYFDLKDKDNDANTNEITNRD